MKDMNELLKTIQQLRNESEPIIDYKKVAERIIKPNYFVDIQTDSILNRMLPACYSKINIPNVKITSFNDETLFYIFYAMNETEIQIQAFNELIQRRYLYSIKLEEFFVKPNFIIDNLNSQTLTVFNPYKWEKENIEIIFDDEFNNSIISNLISYDSKNDHF